MAQILPKEGSKLNFRLVGFSFPAERGVKQYNIEIASGDFYNEGDFKKHIIATRAADRNELILEVPNFGQTYTWRVVNSQGTGALHHFSIAYDEKIDLQRRRLRVVKQTQDYGGSFILMDGAGLIYDFKGAPIAFLPPKKKSFGKRDLSITTDGTLTYIDGDVAEEVSLSGKVLWRAPEFHALNKDTLPYKYHHELQKLPNGHYMVLGSEFLLTKQEVSKDTAYTLFTTNSFDKGVGMGEYSTIIEFDAKGKIVWSWKESEHLPGTDYDYYNWAEKGRRKFANSNGFPEPTLPPGVQSTMQSPAMGGGAIPPPPPPMRNFPHPADPMALRSPMFMKYDPHANSFWYDQRQGVLYVCYRNISRVLKVDYKSGRVLAVYGERFKPQMKSVGDGIFCNPHAIRKSASGDLYFFNNNSCKGNDSMPSVIFLREQGGQIAKVWEYQCKDDQVFNRKVTNGGSVQELSDGSIFVSMGLACGKMFVVNKAREERWTGVAEMFMPLINSWIQVGMYRANVVTERELSSLIWNAEKEN